ncbi:MAG: hypothetical protein AB7T06_39540 [Kofleriaceae bacterium]
MDAETLTAIGAGAGTVIAAGAAAGVAVWRRLAKKTDAPRARANAGEPPSEPGIEPREGTGRHDLTVQRQLIAQADLLNAIYELELEASTARVGERQRDATLARAVEQLEQVYLRLERVGQEVVRRHSDGAAERADIMRKFERLRESFEDLRAAIDK